MRNRRASCSAFVFTTCVAMASVTACGSEKQSGSSADTNTAATPPATATPAPAPAPVESAGAMAGAGVVSAQRGKELFSRCITCHQANGEGMPGAFPPLAGSEWVNGPAVRPIAVVLHGLQGNVTVKGATYNSMMLAYGTGVPMTDDEVASVLTYVRTSFGNTAGAVTAEEVAKVRRATVARTTPFTQQELEALR